MLNHPVHTINSKVKAVDASQISNSLRSSVKKVMEADIEQLKIYLGVAYFIFVSLLSITLFS